MQPQNKTRNTPSAYTFDPVILREYDIRGQVGKNLSTGDAYALGLAFGTYVKRNGGARVCVGYDGRLTSPDLSNALIAGLADTGLNVDNVGVGPTPMLYFAVKDSGADGGIMVTGSHNPPDYNGFKMTLLKEPVFGEKIQEIGRIAAGGNFESGNGTVQEKDIQDHYVDRLMQDLDTDKALRIAWDNGNGAAGDILRRLTGRLPGEHFLLYDDIDGNFPNHHPDPTVDQNLTDLQKLVEEKNCDLGIAFDGDGDRIGVVDDEGMILRCDILMTIYAREIIEKNPGAAIIGDVKCSQIMFDEIERMGGTPVMWKTGHSLIKAKMSELNAPLAGELSGHIFFADRYYGFDDALYCSVRLINEVAKLDGQLSDKIASLPSLFSTAEVRLDVDEAEKFDLVPRLIENLKQTKAAGIEIDDIDGARISTPEGWWLVRPSNTQSVLVARAEASSPEGLKRLMDMAAAEVDKLGYALEFSGQAA